ncbi:MAG: NADP-dependent oxidoreductase [Chloroflexi bacterium]|jgi:NADPH:quinone reductase|nr:NADP-dependent oxidoreductase [Chloroflexota bacterium]MBT4074098.1 NADP-dependent oxidoreductase [Chloroflexota bacterium]MBT4513820.1 NADP-dependent oxidoreductase [Chloroflexota bacterium]MBT6681899.1 NADP-dependent oxidoreductase [Chloroflexota bacterium]
MPENVNRQWVLKSRPDGMPKESDLELIETPIPETRHGELLVKNLWMSIDPYMRGRLRDGPSYAEPVPIGGVLQGESVGRVVESKLEGFKSGDIVRGHIGWQEYGILDVTGAHTVDTSLGPISTSVGVLGMPGLTAYFGLLEVNRPQPGDTIVVSAASGAVGAIVGQIAKIMSCRVVGIAGSDEKVSYIVDELGFDAGINYKTQDVASAIEAACPNGVDGYFDNVGGEITEAVMPYFNLYARMAICGRISEYNEDTPSMGPRVMRFVHAKQAVVEGFLVFRWEDRYEEGRARLAQWVKNGQIKYLEDVVEGFENAPKAFIGQLGGANFGKLLIKVSDE